MLPIGFLNPLMLLALVALPAIWWLLRLTPPRPREILFPPTRLLAEIERPEETPAHSPWWLTALRLLAAAAVILALAGPVWQPVEAGRPVGNGPLWLVVDNGWASARDWQGRQATLAALLDDAERQDRPVVVVATADGPGQTAAPQSLAPMTAGEARERVAALAPRPFAPDRTGVFKALADSAGDSKPGLVAFASDGMAYDDGAAMTTLAALAGEAPITVYRPDGPLPRALGVADNASEALTVPVLRAETTGGGSGLVEARDTRNIVLATAPFSFKAGEATATARFDLPIELRNDIARLDIAAEDSAAAVRLLDDRWRRRTVGIVSGDAREGAQPLLSPLHYLTKALAPFADIRLPTSTASATGIGELLDQRVAVIVLADVGTLDTETANRLSGWIRDGGVLIRFAGPHLAAGGDALIPVTLRSGGRVLGGSLTWEKPQPLASFNRRSPFADLRPPADVVVTRQVLAEPTPDLEDKAWASLGDGTPLVTASSDGRGWTVLYHVTADTTWSNLPLSGVFVDMLRRTVALSAARGAATGSDASGAVLAPFRLLDGYGRFAAPSADAEPIAVADFADTRVGGRHPPGLYGVADAFRALNVIDAETVLRPLDPAALGAAASLAGYRTEGPLSLRPALLTAALALFLIDALAVLFLTGGGLAGLMRRPAAVLVAGALGLAALSGVQPARAQAQSQPQSQPQAPAASAVAEDPAIDFSAALTPRLAYVRTGNAEIDRVSERGLAGLSDALARRTALEPGAPVGLDIGSDELAFYSLIYWPIDAAMDVPSRAAMGRIEAYMKNGGTVLFDTRDQLSAPIGSTEGATPETMKLRQLLAGLDIPPLEPVPLDHVLTKAFYLLQDFPGRWSGSPLWVEASADSGSGQPADRPVRAGDGVSPILITGNDFAGAWAIDEAGNPMFPTVPPDGFQREWSLRAGVNIVMYMMTGNYKADQVHIPALLLRLGQ